MKKVLSIIGALLLWFLFLLFTFLLLLVIHVNDGGDTVFFSAIEAFILLVVPMILTFLTLKLLRRNRAEKAVQTGALPTQPIDINRQLIPQDDPYNDTIERNDLILLPSSPPSSPQKELSSEPSYTFQTEEPTPVELPADPVSIVDGMTGSEFEEYCAALLINNGFTNVYISGKSGDQGVDITAVKDGIRYAIQCKCYSSDLGNTPVQEVYAGKNFYNCHVGVVMTNRYFTTGAKDLARSTGVLLWDRDKIEHMIMLASNINTNAKINKSYVPETDVIFNQAVEIVIAIGQASISILQKRLRISYSRAARLVDQMEEYGIVGPFEGSNPRQVLITKQQWQEMLYINEGYSNRPNEDYF